MWMIDPYVEPTRDEWRELYAAAALFHELKPWQWMADSDLFGVRNPETGVVGYCTVMGNAGEHFALGVYRGTIGLMSYELLASGALQDDPLALMTAQEAIIASFEDREVLESQDLKPIRALGLKFRGRAAWPHFRSYHTGWAPWYLCSAEARFLAVAFRQAMGIAERFRTEPDMLDGPDEAAFLVRVPRNGGWQDAWLEPGPVEEIADPLLRWDTRLIREMSGYPKGNLVVELHSDALPITVMDAEAGRPFVPIITLAVSTRDGLVLEQNLGRMDRAPQDALDLLVNAIAARKSLPRELRVMRGSPLAPVFAEMVKPLGIRVKQMSSLPAAEAALRALVEYMGTA